MKTVFETISWKLVKAYHRFCELGLVNGDFIARNDGKNMIRYLKKIGPHENKAYKNVVVALSLV